MSESGPQGSESGPPAWQTSSGWWFRRVGLPLIALVVIAGVIVWLQRPDDSVTRSTALSDVPLENDSAAPQEGALAPDFSVETLDGQRVRLSELRGQVVVLNFWATWCGPCREEMPLFERATAEFAGQGLVLIAINVQERPGTVRPFVERLGLTYRIGLDENGSVARRYRVRSYPTTYFVGRDGAIEGRRVGAYTRQILFGRLEQLLDGE